MLSKGGQLPPAMPGLLQEAALQEIKMLQVMQSMPP
jgi:hypothetical protein